MLWRALNVNCRALFSFSDSRLLFNERLFEHWRSTWEVEYCACPVPTLHYFCVRCTIRHYAKPLHATLLCLYVRCTIRHYAKPFHATLYCLYVRCTIRHYAEPFHTTLHCFYVRCTIRHYAEPFPAALHHMCVRCTILNYAEPFDATLHRLCVRCATRHYPEPFISFTTVICSGGIGKSSVTSGKAPGRILFTFCNLQKIIVLWGRNVTKLYFAN